MTDHEKSRAEWFAANRSNWDERADIHIRDEAGFYGIEAAVRGESLLSALERPEIGDLAGLRVAHLQCHIGTDTLALIGLGAAEAVGLDFSPRALVHARDLARRAGLEDRLRFVEGNVYDAPALTGGGFDLAYVSWGAICWLDDLDLWARAAAGVLKPGGRIYLAESHPAMLMFDETQNPPRHGYDYGTPREAPILLEESSTYDGSSAKLVQTRTYEWVHPISRVVNALIKAGFRLDFLNEHEALTWVFFPDMTKGEDGLYRRPASEKRMPLAFSLGATRAA